MALTHWQLVVVAIVLPLGVGCAPVNSQAPVLIEYQRSGGIAGRTDHVVIRGDGTARLSRRADTADLTIPADSLARLRALLGRIPFDSLRAEYLPPRPGADLYEYIIIYGGRRVRTMDTAIPADLAPLIESLNAILRSAR
jgi:hypothetical protein